MKMHQDMNVLSFILKIWNLPQSSHDYDISTDVTIPLLDEPISQEEVCVQVRILQPDMLVVCEEPQQNQSRT